MAPNKGLLLILISLSLALIFSSCDERTAQKGDSVKDFKIDSTKSSIVNVSGKLFSIPSPIQTALLIKQSNAAYNKAVLSNPKDADKYVNKSDRALNLGIYGADMAYTSFYEDPQESIKYFRALDLLSENLEIKGAVDAGIIKRLSSNLENPDSLLILSGKFYEAADVYLKENERADVAALILTGTWIESTMLTALAAKEGNQNAFARLAQQKKSINTLSDVLSSLNSDGLMSSILIGQLDSLKASYSEVSREYEYREPVTYADTKTTRITSTSTYQMSDSVFMDITDRLTRMRNEIIN
ncbi:MAG TPA: hypothetical protein VJ911_03115 [Cryomorphaceae bacterium]|nr:hypothetical protein [Cryomorphaceae bacterium]